MTGVQPKNLAAAGAVSAIPCRVMAVTVDANHADWKIELTDDADGLGTNVLVLSGEAEGGQTDFNFAERGGIIFPTKCYAAITTTGGLFQFFLG